MYDLHSISFKNNITTSQICYRFQTFDAGSKLHVHRIASEALSSETGLDSSTLIITDHVSPSSISVRNSEGAIDIYFQAATSPLLGRCHFLALDPADPPRCMLMCSACMGPCKAFSSCVCLRHRLARYAADRLCSPSLIAFLSCHQLLIKNKDCSRASPFIAKINFTTSSAF